MKAHPKKNVNSDYAGAPTIIPLREKQTQAIVIQEDQQADQQPPMPTQRAQVQASPIAVQRVDIIPFRSI